jgi:hypothetical protein
LFRTLPLCSGLIRYKLWRLSQAQNLKLTMDNCGTVRKAAIIDLRDMKGQAMAKVADATNTLTRQYEMLKAGAA